MKFLYKILYYMAILLIFIIVTSLTAVYVFAGNEITWDLSLVLAFLFVPVILVLCLICHFSLTSLSEMPFNNQYYKTLYNKVNNETHGRFEELYNKLYSENYEYLEKLRKKERIIKTIRIIIEVCVFILCIYFETIYFSVVVLIFSISIIILLTILYIIQKRNREKNYSNEYKEKIVKKFILMYDNNLEYFPEIKDTEILKRKYLEAEMDNREFSHFSVDDYVVGRVNDSYIEFFNVDIRSKDTFLFSGIFATITLNKKFDKKIRITSKGIANSYYSNNEKLKSIRMDSQRFGRLFNVYAEDDISGMMILTHDIMELLENFYNNNNTKLDVSIIDNKIYIRLFTGDIFEPLIYRNSMDKTYLSIYYNVLDTIFNLCKLVLKEIIDENI